MADQNISDAGLRALVEDCDADVIRFRRRRLWQHKRGDGAPDPVGD